jgi:CheY-like chemotaxis protein
VVQESLGLLQSTRPPAITLEVALASELLHARIDATQIQQVLMNLCTNAWYAMEGAAGTLRVTLEPVHLAQVQEGAGQPLPAGDYARLSVQDNGVGMTAQALDRAFEPFFTTKPTGMGTGLGLSVVHGIVAAHAGAIRIQSQPGQGCTVEVLLPISEPPVHGQEQGPRAAESALTCQPRGAGQHVLYVDDDEVVGQMVQPLLQRAGYRVTLMNDGRDAVKAVQAQADAFDIVVTDFNMPGLSGLDVAQALQTLRPSMPVVLSTGYITEDLLDHARRLGVRHVMQKENSLEELVRLVHEALHA